MSFWDLGGLFDSGNDNQTTQTSSFSPPQFVEDSFRKTYNILDNLSTTAYEPYNQGPRIAGFSNMQQDIINKFSSGLGSKPYQSGSAWAGLQGLGSSGGYAGPIATTGNGNLMPDGSVVPTGSYREPSGGQNPAMIQTVRRNADGTLSDAMGNPIQTGQTPSGGTMTDADFMRRFGAQGGSSMNQRGNQGTPPGGPNGMTPAPAGYEWEFPFAIARYDADGNLLPMPEPRLVKSGSKPSAMERMFGGGLNLPDSAKNWFTENYGAAPSAPAYQPGSAWTGLPQGGDMAAAQREYIMGLGGQGLAELVARPELKGMALGNIGDRIQGVYGAGSGTAADRFRELAQTIQNTPGADVQAMQRDFVNQLSAGDIGDLLRMQEAANYGPNLKNILSTRLGELAAAGVETPMGQAFQMAKTIDPISAQMISGLPTVEAQDVTAGSIAGTDLSQYMNPFMSAALAPALEEMNRQAKIANLGVKASATHGGAFGDARHGVAEAELMGRVEDIKSQRIAEMMMGGYDRATSLAGQDIGTQLQAALANQGAGLTADRSNLDAMLTAARVNQAADLEAQRFNQTGQLDAAGLLGNLASQQQDMDLRDLATRWDIGSQVQQMNQSNLDLMYEDWRRQQQHPFDMLNMRLNALSGQRMPYSQTTTAPGPNESAQNMGAIAAILGGLGTFWR